MREAHEWRFRMNAPGLTHAVQRAFEEWKAADPIHTKMFERAQLDYEALGALSKSDIDSDLVRPIRAELPASKGNRGLRSLPSLRSMWKPVAIGFTAVMAVSVVFVEPWFGTSPVQTEAESPRAEFTTTTGEVKTVVLADGSQVTLSAASHIEAAFSKEQRTVFLQAGAAFFDVVSDPDRPFVVEAGALNARVLGTEFEVSRNTELVRVAVAEGLVEVSHPYVLDEQLSSLRSLIKLSAGDSVNATRDEGLSVIKRMNAPAIGAWRQGKLFYDGARLAELVADANRYTEKHVLIAEGSEIIADYRVRGAFNASDIDGMLSTLSDIYPVTIDRSEAGTVRISSRE